MQTKISVVGLGKLGACSAACFASKGFKVIGVDVNKDFVNAINNGKAPVYEPRLQELITSARNKLKATQDYREAIRESDITFLIVPTPSVQDGHFSDRYLQDALKHLSVALKETDKQYHLFVITSTVSPGTIDENLIPLIELHSGKKLNKDFGVCYNPEFIALGNVINDFLNPDLVLIGESDGYAGGKLAEIYHSACENKPYIARMSIISAEITKISLNAYVTMKISFANTLANICGKIPGADVDVITKALGADKRISPYYLKGGMSFGGPCFPRDNKAFIAFAQKYGCQARLAKATDEVNELQAEHLTDFILDCLSHNGSNAVSILGIAFKPKTPVIEKSPGMEIVTRLLRENIRVTVYDPLAMENIKAVFGNAIEYAPTVKDCLNRSSFCIITTPCEEFKAIDDTFITHNQTTIIDCWRILDPSRFSKKAKYLPWGKAH